MENEVAPYWADFIPDCHLPTANCITSLQFTRFLITTEIPFMGGYRCGPEDQISVPAVLKIAAACGALQTLSLNARYGFPFTEPVMRRNARDAIAAALSHLPSSVHSIEYIGDAPRAPSLHIDEEAVFTELFCPEETQGYLQTYWPLLEKLYVMNIDDYSSYSAMIRYADGNASNDTLLERYIDDLYTTAGYAARKMPRMNDLLVQFCGYGLSFGHYKGKWSLEIQTCRGDTYVPSSRFLEAWKVPGGQLEFGPRSHTQMAIYDCWPPV
ncbi:hypothetical protein E4T50_13810 [Aureobasidium sp. EXF-12298]|nr:hypothetical protein E4T50_13810 [Aureobasidium sp. EXF-12298]